MLAIVHDPSETFGDILAIAVVVPFSLPLLSTLLFFTSRFQRINQV
jgi:hypothetical protein